MAKVANINQVPEANIWAALMVAKYGSQAVILRYDSAGNLYADKLPSAETIPSEADLKTNAPALIAEFEQVTNQLRTTM